MSNEIEKLAGVTPFVVIPGYNLDKIIIEGDTCFCIKD
jgi:hypothetical protein